MLEITLCVELQTSIHKVQSIPVKLIIERRLESLNPPLPWEFGNRKATLYAGTEDG